MADNDAVTTSENGLEVVISRFYDAPARLLFEAYSKPEHIKRFFGPIPYPVTSAEMDFRVGGTFRFQMTGPDGELGTPFGGTYLEIVPHERIVYDNGFLVPGAEKMVVTLLFEERGGRTLHTNRTVFASEEMRRIHVGGGYVEGTSLGLEQLEEYLRKWPAPAQG